MKMELINDESYTIIPYPTSPSRDESGRFIKFRYETLFKLDTRGDIRQWCIGYDPETELIVIESGLADGKNVVKTKPVVTNSSGRNIDEQALIFVKQSYNKKRNQKLYSEFIDQAVEVFEPMLAHTYMKVNRVRGQVKVLKDGTISYSNKITEWPVWVSWKLDGFRMLARRNKVVTDVKQDIILLTRNNQRHPYMYHIREELNRFFDFLPSGCVIDGEAYTKQLTFNELQSAITTGRAGNKAEHHWNYLIEYWIFDVRMVDPDVPFCQRYQSLIDAYNNYKEMYDDPLYLVIVGCEEVDSHEELMEKQHQYESEGYEGIIIRKPYGIYRSGRHTDLMKSKSTIDEEGTIIDVDEEQTHPPGQAILKIKDSTGVVFTLRPPGDVAMRQAYLTNKDSYIGTTIKFKYQERTEEGLPRFPTSVAQRDFLT